MKESHKCIFNVCLLWQGGTKYIRLYRQYSLLLFSKLKQHQRYLSNHKRLFSFLLTSFLQPVELVSVQDAEALKEQKGSKCWTCKYNSELAAHKQASCFEALPQHFIFPCSACATRQALRASQHCAVKCYHSILHNHTVAITHTHHEMWHI